MKFFIFFIAQILACTCMVNAQRTCVTAEINTGISLEAANANSVNETGRDTLKNEQIIIPVVIHVLYKDAAQNISSEQILSQLESLNKDFNRLNADAINTPGVFSSRAADVKIKFCLARVDPQGRPTSGIIRKYTGVANFLADDAMKFSSAGGDNAWDSKRYLNIWVCKLFGRTLGYATYPGGAADRDGVVIAYDAFGTSGVAKAPFNKGRTATHEIGHWLGLKHIWGDANCGSDDVADTPPQQAYNTGCPSFPHMSSCSVNSNGDMFMNFMDFADDACMNMFTHGQKTKMRSLFASGGSKNLFLQSNACDSSIAEDGPLPVETIAIPVVISVYPNPVVNEIFIDIKQSDPIVSSSFVIINSTGIVQMKGRLLKAKSSLNISALPRGFYFLRIGEGTEVVTKKILKQ